MQWFNDISDASNVELKQSADHAYMTKDYLRAVGLYHQAFDMTSKRNMSSRRDILEGLARSHLKLGDLGEAEKMAEELVCISKFCWTFFKLGTYLTLESFLSHLINCQS